MQLQGRWTHLCALWLLLLLLECVAVGWIKCRKAWTWTGLPWSYYSGAETQDEARTTRPHARAFQHFILSQLLVSTLAAATHSTNNNQTAPRLMSARCNCWCRAGVSISPAGIANRTPPQRGSPKCPQEVSVSQSAVAPPGGSVCTQSASVFL